MEIEVKLSGAEATDYINKRLNLPPAVHEAIRLYHNSLNDKINSFYSDDSNDNGISDIDALKAEYRELDKFCTKNSIAPF